MEQSSAVPSTDRIDEPAGASPESASRSVYRGIMRALETQQIVPGQRLIETELAVEFGVGRNAVREALQWLAARGVIAAIRHRSAAIRRLSPTEVLEVLDIADVMIALAARTAAAQIAAADPTRIDRALADLEAADEGSPGAFDRARRHLFAALLTIGGNRELERLFPSVALHILFAQHRGPALRRDRLDELRAIGRMVAAGDPAQAELAAHAHVESMRRVMREKGAER